jgi:hypothetical protein
LDLMAYPEQPVDEDARAAIELALAPWGGPAACIDAYEAGIRALTDLQRSVARAIDAEPARTITASCAELTRDIAATQVSSARWLLDV